MQLRPIMEEHLKDNPAMLAGWKLALRVAASRDTESATTPDDSGSGTGTTALAGS